MFTKEQILGILMKANVGVQLYVGISGELDALAKKENETPKTDN